MKEGLGSIKPLSIVTTSAVFRFVLLQLALALVGLPAIIPVVLTPSDPVVWLKTSSHYVERFEGWDHLLSASSISIAFGMNIYSHLHVQDRILQCPL